MSAEIKTPRIDILRRMSYSELRQCAKKHGIKANAKADNLIASILETTSNDEDSFVVLERKLYDSFDKCKQDKFVDDKMENSNSPRRAALATPLKTNEDKIQTFDTDKKIPSDTPRRETYSLEGPSDVTMAINEDSIFKSASPVLKMSPEILNSPNVCLMRGSEKRLKSRKVSFVTPLRRSVRLSMSNVKDRPKTPIPSRISSGKKLLPSVLEGKVDPVTEGLMGSVAVKTWSPSTSQMNQSLKLSSGSRGKRPSTPMPSSKQKKSSFTSSEKFGRESSSIATTVSDLLLEEDEEVNQSDEKGVSPNTKSNESTVECNGNIDKKMSQALITNDSNVQVKMDNLSKELKPKIITPVIKKTPGRILRTTKAVQVTPNFTKLHQKAFDKMESIDGYNKRKALLSAQKIKDQARFHTPGPASKTKAFAAQKVQKIPKMFGGIPFVPSVMSTKHLNTNFASIASKQHKENNAVLRRATPARSALKATSNKTASVKKNVPTKEKVPVKKRTKFDLKASLSRKLPYKPYTGPLKPMNSSRANVSMQANVLNTPLPAKKENRVVAVNRMQSRGVLRGVRKNKRFELQMRNRRLEAD